jgi:regulatory protein
VVEHAPSADAGNSFAFPERSHPPSGREQVVAQRVPSTSGGGPAPTKPRGTAKDRALGLLAVRWRSRRELETRLRAAGFEDQQVEVALDDLQGAGLIDDRRFASELARARSGRRDGNRAVRSALAKAGVAPVLAEEVVADLGDDEERAVALAASRAPRMAGLEPEAAFRRLYGFLLRRGHGPDVARDACRRALAGLPDQELHEP